MTQQYQKRYSRKPKLCEACGETFIPPRYNSKYCSVTCFSAARRATPRKSIGKVYNLTTRDGVKNRAIILNDGRRVAEHRVIFEQFWKVKLKAWHRVRHINGDTLDNRPENLTLDNKYAMELLRQGKSIAEVGRSICTEGHPRNHPQQLKNGTVRYVCLICVREHARDQRARQARGEVRPRKKPETT